MGEVYSVRCAVHGKGCLSQARVPYGTKDVTCLSGGGAFRHQLLFRTWCCTMYNGVFPLCLLPICLLLYNIVPSCLLHIFSPKIKCLLPNYIIITHLSYVTCSEGLSVHSVRYRPRHLLQGARTCRSSLASHTHRSTRKGLVKCLYYVRVSCRQFHRTLKWLLRKPSRCE